MPQFPNETPDQKKARLREEKLNRTAKLFNLPPLWQNKVVWTKILVFLFLGMAIVQDYCHQLEVELDEALSKLGSKLAPKLGTQTDQIHPILAEMPVIPAVDRRGNRVRLRNFVNQVRTGKYWRELKLSLMFYKQKTYQFQLCFTRKRPIKFKFKFKFKLKSIVNLC